MLRLKQLRWQGGSFTLNVADWSMGAGEFHVLAGCNGAGKSTLLKALSGELRVAGQSLLHERALPQWSAQTRARHLAVLPQTSELSFPFSTAEVVSLGATPLSLSWRQRREAVVRLLRRTDTHHLRDRDYRQLSGGERQRVHLARVLLQLSQAELAPLLLLDEPTSAQDLGQQHALLGFIRELATQQNYGIVAVLHDINLCLRYATRVSLLEGGRVVDSGTPEGMLTEDSVQRHWGCTVSTYYNKHGARLIA